MIYPHQQKAIDYITDRFLRDPQVDALLISGSIAHGYNDANSDVDLNIVASGEHGLTWWESAEEFYPGGYFDGKYITLDYLANIAERGNEASKFALHDAIIAFDRTGLVAGLQRQIAEYPTGGEQERIVRFLSQLDAWKWYCDEGLKRNNRYLLDYAASKLILFAGRLILLENRMFFPYHKWFLRVLEDAAKKPPELMPMIGGLLEEKSAENITRLYELVKNYKDWTEGAPYNWGPHFVYDTELFWMRQEETIDNL